jgi:hypothetical protein
MPISGVMMMNRFDQNTRLVDVPVDAFRFNMRGECAFEAGDEEKKNIRLMLYDGSVVAHWFWGNLAFELKSMRLAKKSVPILHDHETDRRVGFSTAATFDGEFVMEGRQLENEHAQSIRSDAMNGFPFEASLRFDPANSKITHIMENEEVEVNGHTLEGPGAVITNTSVMEGSVVTFGALNKCETKVFNHNGNKDKETDMVDTTQMTAESFAKDHPDIHKAIVDGAFAKGQEEAKKRFGEFKGLFSDDPGFLVEQFGKGATVGEATVAQNKVLKDRLAKAEENGGETGGGGDNDQAAHQEFSDEQTEPDQNEQTGGPANFDEAVDEYAKLHKCKRGKAIRECSVKYPELHKAMKRANIKVDENDL